MKSRVTPGLRAQLGVEIQRSLREVDQEMTGIMSQLDKAQATLSEKERARLEKDRQELVSRRESLARQLKDIARLTDGQELSRGQIQGFYDLKVGDPWPDVLSCEVVIEDGRVVAMREGSSVTALVPDRQTL